ncbi:MAG TPA: septation protein SepH [Aeromicrobium sp.]|nr:septation protein SepH [Aeromicrobium sp.]
MRELGLTGLSEDGRFLVAHDALTDESFHIPTDTRLTSLLDVSPSGSSSARTATQTDREAGNRETTMETTLSPRDIQTRIRRGESPEQVAEQSGMPVDKVRGFAVPVIAEREFIVEQARKTSVRRLHSTGTPGMLLGSLVDTGLAATGASVEAAKWDSWRREDGRWTVVVAADGALEPVTFLFDVKGRYVLPADDAAHELIGDVVQDVLNATPDMALANAVREEPPHADAPTVEEYLVQSVEVVETVEIVETVERVQSPVDDLPNYDDVPFEIPMPEEILEHSAPVSSLKEARDRRALEQLALAIDSQAEAPAESSDVEITEEQNLAVPSTPHPSSHAASKKRHERRRVPSWDEIMFGGTPQD